MCACVCGTQEQLRAYTPCEVTFTFWWHSKDPRTSGQGRETTWDARFSGTHTARAPRINLHFVSFIDSLSLSLTHFFCVSVNTCDTFLLLFSPFLHTESGITETEKIISKVLQETAGLDISRLFGIGTVVTLLLLFNIVS